MVVLKILLIILLVYYGVKLLGRFFAPLVLKYIFNRVQKKMEQQFNPPPNDYKNQSSQSKANRKKTPKDDKVGEYIDYEEID